MPAVANWKLSAIPRAIPPSQVDLVLAAIDRKKVVGRRDYAILLILARLGLRAGEIKTLTNAGMPEMWPGNASRAPRRSWATA